MSNWKLQLPTSNSVLTCSAGSVDEESPSQVAAGFTNRYFYTGSDGAMTFWAPINGATTGGSSYPRSELREEISPGNDGVDWTPYGAHILNAQCKVLQVPTSTLKVIIGQVHGYSGAALPTVKVEYSNGKVYATVKTNSTDDGSDYDFPTVTVGLSNTINYTVQIVNGLVSVAINNKTNSYNIFQSDPSYTNETGYFKAGDYCQADSCSNPGTNDGARVAFYMLSRYHAPSLTNQPASQTASVGSNVTFTVGALGNPPFTYVWQFNSNPLNGATNATLSIPNAQLTNAGMYSVIVSDITGSVTSTNATLTVLATPPVASFTANPTNGVVPLGVTFTDTSSGSPTSWSWAFGDTGTSTSQNPGHTYATPGTYTVMLIASNTGGSSTNTRVNLITALAPPPVASFTLTPTSGAAPLGVSFTDSSSGSITGWAWVFGDGNTSTTQNPTDVYVNPGVYTVQEIVSGPGGSSTDTVVNLVNAYDPFAWWQLSYFGLTNGTVAMSPSGDYTGTGMSNTNKFLAGFNPTNPAAYLHIISIAITNAIDVNVTYLGANGDNTWSPGVVSRTNVLEFTAGTPSGDYSNNFVSANVTNILSSGTGTGLVTSMVDPGGATNMPSRYYRVRVLVP
ncbi:MAG TPA: polysaccharide lyase family 7 protein [Verrucomicrobiae bacterium]|nr:polysaccharide lyase family 7 protein [Verrucomicrobiae bacterium]